MSESEMRQSETGEPEQGVTELLRTEALVVRQVSVSDMDNNCYLLTCRATGRQLLVDAADEPQRLLGLVSLGSDQGLDLVVTTHQHWDHHRALPDVVRATGARTAAGRDDAPALPVDVDVVLDHGDTVTAGELRLEVLHLRGHTPGSVALLHRDADGSTHLFTGDSLFPGGPGKTTDPADFTSLMDDLESRVFAALPDDTRFYPGHGRGSTLGAERPQLPEWRARGW